MKVFAQEQPFAPNWPEPSMRLLQEERPSAPFLPLEHVFGARLAHWITAAAKTKSAPPDYIVAGLLAVAGAAIGNTRWSSPWQGWAEPPILWTMAVGLPSSSKSPGLDAVLSPLKETERNLRQSKEPEISEWREKLILSKLAESAWKETTKIALKDGSEPPKRPESAMVGPEPFSPRLYITDATVERLAVIVSKQPRGTLLARDELAGWLHGMTRYSGGGSDRPFWLEAYGGRGFTVERMGREPVHIDRLSIGVVGGIQPDRLNSLLFNSDDDGLLARFLPIWPEPVTIKRPSEVADQSFIDRALKRIHSLQLVTDEHDVSRPWFIPFSEPARDLLDDFRRSARRMESGSEGLLLSFTSKLPGLAVRLSLVLAYLEWAVDGGEEPMEITAEIFDRAAHFVEYYAVPMARRAYVDASHSKSDRAARRLLATIRENGWERFTTRDVLRLGRAGIGTASELNPAIAALEHADIIKGIEGEANPKGGRPNRLYAVNPMVRNAPV